MIWVRPKVTANISRQRGSGPSHKNDTSETFLDIGDDEQLANTHKFEVEDIDSCFVKSLHQKHRGEFHGN